MIISSFDGNKKTFQYHSERFFIVTETENKELIEILKKFNLTTFYKIEHLENNVNLYYCFFISKLSMILTMKSRIEILFSLV